MGRLTIALISSFFIVPGLSGFAVVGACLGLALCGVAPIFLIAIAKELYRSVWQAWRIAAWAVSPEGRSRAKSPEKAAKWKHLPIFWAIFRKDFFSFYDTIRYLDRTFHHTPWKEAAYFERLAREDDAYLARIGAL